MAISLSNAHFSPQDSTGYFVYALRRDDDDMLHFTKVSGINNRNLRSFPS